MKYLLISLMLGLTGCFSSDLGTVDITKLKYKAGQKIKTSAGFYSECYGVITDHGNYYSKRDGILYYTVRFHCPNIGWIPDVRDVSEDSILEIEK